MKLIRHINQTIVLIALIIIFFSSFVLAEEAPTFYGQEIVVTASRIPQLRSEIPASVTIITSEEIKTLGAKNVGDVLNYSFGTATRTTGYLGSQISGSIRGASYQQMLILIDGQRINSPLLGGYDLGDLPVDNIEKVEIVRGPASALYGADAVGGVINIIKTKSDEINKNSLVMLSKFSEKGSNDQKLTLSGVSDQFNYSLSAGEAYSPGYRINGDYKAQKYDGNISKSLGEKFNLGVGFNLYYAKKGVPGSLTFPTPFTRQQDNDQHFRLLSDTKVNDWWDIKLNSSFGNMEQLFSEDPTSIPYDKYRSYSDQYEFQNNIKVGSSDILNIGGEQRNDASRSGLAGNHHVTNKAIYIQDQHYVTTDLSILMSSRYDEHSIYGNTGSPRVGLNYRFNKESSAWVSYGEAFRAPTLNDLYSFYRDPVWGTIMKGSTSLKPESSKSSEIGFITKLNEKTAFNANYFTSRIENLITWVDISGTWMTWEAQNVNTANIAGYEVGLNYYLLTSLKCFVNYTAIAATDGRSGKDLPYKPRTQYNVGLEYNDEQENSAGILVHHVGQRYDNQSNTRKVDAYTVTSVNIVRSISEQMKLTLGAENFLNEDYQDTFDYPMPGRIYTFSLQYNLI